MRIDRLGRVGACAGFLSSALGVARCGRSAGCVLCVLWAMSAAVLGGGGGGGYPVGISISSSKQRFPEKALARYPQTVESRIGPKGGFWISSR